MRQDSHLKMLVSGSSKSAMRPRLRSGSSRFSYGYFRVTGRGRSMCSSVRASPATIPLMLRPSRRPLDRNPLYARYPRPRSDGDPSARGGHRSSGRRTLASSPVDIPEDDVDRAQDRGGAGEEPPLEQPGKDLSV